MIASNPLIGSSRKSLANNVAYRWFDKNIWRSKPVTFTEGVSASRETQKTFFTACQAFSKTVLSVVRIGFKQLATKMPANSYYMGWLLKNAGNSYPGPATLDLDKIIVANGSLQRPNDLAIEAIADNKVSVTWTDDSGTGNALATDKLMVVWFDDAGFISGSDLSGTVKRNTASGEFSITTSPTELDFHVWAFFTSATGALCTPSDIATKVKSIPPD